MVNELDVKEAARLGMHTRPLTTAVVQQHLADLGVDPEFGTHSQMRGLSGEPPPVLCCCPQNKGALADLADCCPLSLPAALSSETSDSLMLL